MFQNKHKKARQKEKKTKLHVTPHGIASETDIHLYNKPIFSWMAPEYIQYPKNKTWYIISAIVVGIMLFSAIAMANYTMVLALVVLVAVYHYLHEKHPPKNIKIVISAMGVKVGNMIFPYSHIQAFWVMYHPPLLKTLNLRVKKRFFTDLVIQLNDQDPAPVRHYLCEQVPEWEGKTENFGETILRLLKL